MLGPARPDRQPLSRFDQGCGHLLLSADSSFAKLPDKRDASTQHLRRASDEPLLLGYTCRSINRVKEKKKPTRLVDSARLVPRVHTYAY